jgi:type I restriction enzyme, S subunit
MFAIKAILDRETSEGTGVGGTFQVVSLIDDEGNDLTYLIDLDRHFTSMDELKRTILREISEHLTVDEV